MGYLALSEILKACYVQLKRFLVYIMKEFRIENGYFHIEIVISAYRDVVSLSHPQLSSYGSAHHISPIRVWRRTLNCMVYSILRAALCYSPF